VRRTTLTYANSRWPLRANQEGSAIARAFPNGGARQRLYVEVGIYLTVHRLELQIGR
jgi:hypothetical protein